MTSFVTLGPHVRHWYATVVNGPAFTKDQRQVIDAWYRINPDGSRYYRRGQLMTAKGWGKSPLAGWIALAELKGPVEFDRIDSHGAWGRERRSPVIQIAAVSEDQAENTYQFLLEFLTENDGERASLLDLDAGQTRILRNGQPTARIDAVTASHGTREGQRVTFAVLDETHLWTKTNGGVKLANTIRRNAAKMGGSTLETTNAYVPGEQSVAQATTEAEGSEGLYRYAPSTDVPSLANKAELRRGLRKVYGAATQWIDVDRLIDEIHDPDTTEADARRFYLNEVVQHAGGAFNLDLWSARAIDIADEAHHVRDGELITIGFDGARHHDSTALWGCRVSDGHLFRLGLWERPAGIGDEEWEVPGDEVDAIVHQTMDRYDVWRMYCDPPRWEQEVNVWAGRYDGVAVKWETYRTRPMAFAVRRFDEALRTGGLTHDGDEALTRHVGNAYKAATKIRDDDGKWLWRIEKEHPKSPRKIDAAMAAILAFEARGDAVASGAANRAEVFVPRRIY
jgi:hypothetical protein